MFRLLLCAFIALPVLAVATAMYSSQDSGGCSGKTGCPFGAADCAAECCESASAGGACCESDADSTKQEALESRETVELGEL